VQRDVASARPAPQCREQLRREMKTTGRMKRATCRVRSSRRLVSLDLRAAVRRKGRSIRAGGEISRDRGQKECGDEEARGGGGLWEGRVWVEGAASGAYRGGGRRQTGGGVGGCVRGFFFFFSSRSPSGFVLGVVRRWTSADHPVLTRRFRLERAALRERARRRAVCYTASPGSDRCVRRRRAVAGRIRRDPRSVAAHGAWRENGGNCCGNACRRAEQRGSRQVR